MTLSSIVLRDDKHMTGWTKMNPEEFLKIAKEIRDEFGLQRGIDPSVVEIREGNHGDLYVVTTDRAEKHMILGPGGRVITEIVKRTGRYVQVFSKDEIILREYRLRLALQRIQEVEHEVGPEQRYALDLLRSMIDQQLEIPPRGPPRESHSHAITVGVALSGGVDSSATAIMLRQWGFAVRPLIVDRGIEFLHPGAKRDIFEFCKKIDSEAVFIPVEKGFSDIVRRTREGRIHPCGPCHISVMNTIHQYAKQNQVGIIATGESLPSGRQSLVIHDGILYIHLPAVLALTKFTTRTLSKEYGVVYRKTRFGCSLLRETYARGWATIGPSVYRVLREVDSGFLSTAEALALIRGIVRDRLELTAE